MRKPTHVGVIIDGNRRYAKKIGKPLVFGHESGYKKVKELIKWCKEFKIKELTIYALSSENLKRPKEEYNYLMKLFEKALNELPKEKEIKQVKINFIGKTEVLPESIQKGIFSLMEKTKNNKPFKLNLAVAYDGRTEILDATKKIAEAVKYNKLNPENITEETIQERLYLASEPDLIIRTSESRLSGFLLWQASYSEIIFLQNILWPELTKEDFIKCLEEYSKRERRFGK